ncbi:aa3-type cytochrome c oxidase subunit IV [Caulobacter sp. 17J65-9]|uniref:aa3-type cytochrome c oxidase subunit IV n=1 Tax=Caulobacter sp. 17J65-9 TaxID=2709382 RepID=UPI0013C55939|nr:aa3-type cytochrome c oxidase subunit IV [Caulobacter sp. 17J65-9]NEX93310.1 aa3-type cytochrome c oxidase subunit IV [Caulobacter sp. 17J65-9]
MAGPAHDYHRGDMDISEQKSTYELFTALTKWGSLFTAVVLLFLTVCFAVGAGFIPAAIAAGVLLVGGWWYLRKKPFAEH